MAKPYENFHTGQTKCDGRQFTSTQREQKAHFLLSTATYGHKQVAAGYWHLLLAMLGEQRLALSRCWQGPGKYFCGITK